MAIDRKHVAHAEGACAYLLRSFQALCNGAGR